MSSLSKAYRLDAVPADTGEHLHSCPVSTCSHEFVIRRVEGDPGTRPVTVAYRNSMTSEGPKRIPVKVKLAGACWCGAPLPREETVTFDDEDVARNVQRAKEILASLDEAASTNEEASI
tara:strand:- start:29 stop:385 length:357 start_codon:yes stop_codon:yes gene_type:complete